MKVYLVWTGEYSDRGVDAVCSTEELANKRAIELRASWVECVEVDAEMPRPETRVWWLVHLVNSAQWHPEQGTYGPDRWERTDASMVHTSSEARPPGYIQSRAGTEIPTTGDVRVFCAFPTVPGGYAGWDMYTNVEAPTSEAAIKIATERFQREIALAAMMGKPFERVTVMP